MLINSLSPLGLIKEKKMLLKPTHNKVEFL